MTAGNPGGETVRSDTAETGIILPGSLIESMHGGLMRVLGFEQTFAALRAEQTGLIETAYSDSAPLTKMLEGAQNVVSPRPSNHQNLAEWLSYTSSSLVYHSDLIDQVGVAGLLLGAEDKIKEDILKSWADGPTAQDWQGENVRLRRPPESVTSMDDKWGSHGPPYRLLSVDEPSHRYYPGGGRADFYGKLLRVSLEQAGSVVLEHERGVTEVIEMFEEIKDPATGVVISYVPRVSVERVNRTERLKRAARHAAIERRTSPIEDVF